MTETSDRRIRTIRIALCWALVVGTYMTTGVWPITSDMAMGAWINSLLITGATVFTLVVILCIRRWPRATALGLLPVGFVGILMLATTAAVALGPGGSRWAAPARVLSLLMTGTYAAALVVAAVLAWPLRRLSEAPLPDGHFR